MGWGLQRWALASRNRRQATISALREKIVQVLLSWQGSLAMLGKASDLARGYWWLTTAFGQL